MVGINKTIDADKMRAGPFVGTFAPLVWQRCPVLRRFLHFARKVSGCRFRRQRHRVVGGSSPVRIGCNNHCCRLFESDANRHPVAALEVSIPAHEKAPRFPGLIQPVAALRTDGDAIWGLTRIFGERLWRAFARPTPSREISKIVTPLTRGSRDGGAARARSTAAFR